MTYTTDRDDERLKDIKPDGQQTAYLVLSEEERKKGFIRPYRDAYVHKTCGVETKMGAPLAETYARDPKFYGGTYCVECGKHFPVSEFAWLDGEQVGS